MGVGSAPHRRRRGGTRPTLWCEGRGLRGKSRRASRTNRNWKKKKRAELDCKHDRVTRPPVPHPLRSGRSRRSLVDAQSTRGPIALVSPDLDARNRRCPAQRGYKTQANHYTDEAYSLQSDCGAGLGRSDSDEMADSDIDLASGRRPRAMKTRFGRESRGSSGMVRQ